jgi:hypothetical protein
MAILFVILHSQAAQERRRAIKSTWGHGQDCFFCSDHNEPPDVYQLSNRSDHGSAEIKHTHAFSHLLFLEKKYEWYFFCDDDTFVNAKLLINDLDRFDQGAIHGQAINCWTGDTSLVYPSGGAGYLMHSKLLQKMPSIVSIPHTGYSDVTFGIHLRSSNIALKHNDGFLSQPPSFYNIDDSKVSSYYTFHYIKTSDEVRRLHQLCEV